MLILETFHQFSLNDAQFFVIIVVTMYVPNRKMGQIRILEGIVLPIPEYFCAPFINTNCPRHCGSYKPGKLRRLRHKSSNIKQSAVQSSQFSWAGQYKKSVQYEFKFT